MTLECAGDSRVSRLTGRTSASCNLRSCSSTEVATNPISFVNSTTDQLQQPWLSNPAAAPRRMPSQLSNQPITHNDFVLFAEDPRPSVPINRQTRPRASNHRLSLTGNKPRSSYDFDCTSTPASNLSTVQHAFDPDTHWFDQEYLAINTSLPFGTLPAANMTADHLMNSHLERAAASAASFSRDEFQLLDDDYEDDSFNFDNTTLDDTVSPNDLIYKSEFTPALPINHSFESLATPSLLDDTSPFINDDLDVSPAFENFNSFTPLFGSNEIMLPAAKKRKHVEPKISGSTESLTKLNSAEMSRVSSSQSIQDRGLLRQRLSIADGLPKTSHRQSRELAPIEVEDGDEIAAKRAKNTMAARKSRQKKKDEVAQLEDRLIEVMNERDYWKMLAVKYGAPMPTPSPSAMSPM